MKRFPFGRQALRFVGALCVALAATSGAGVRAQNLFAPAIIVNDDVITHFELEQRARFMEVLRAPGDLEKRARKELIDDRLREQAIEEAGIEISEDALRAGIEEFAGRTQLSSEQLVQALGQEGIAPETLRDFVRTNLGWREFVRGKFLDQSRPTPQEIDRAMSERDPASTVRVLLAEVIIPITPETADQVDELARQISELKSYTAFSQAATQYSASPTRNQGGRLGWLPLNNLPPQLRQVILELKPGESTAPLPLPNAIAVFQLRGIDELREAVPSYSQIDYAEYFIPGGRSPEALARAQQVRDSVDTCNDLYGIADGQPEAVLERHSAAPGAIPRDVALELAKLDEGEVSTALTRNNGQTLVLLMLCGRVASANAGLTREDMAARLTQERLANIAENYLERLRANSVIVER